MGKSDSLCVVTHRLFAENNRLLSTCCMPITNESDSTLPRNELIRRAAGAQALIAFMPDCIDSDFLDRCPHLGIVAAALKGFDNIDINACSQRGVMVSIVPDHLSAPTAELAIGLALGLSRHVLTGDNDVRSGLFSKWRPTLYGMGFESSDIGFLGFGCVGQAIAQRLQGFNANFLAFDSNPDSVQASRLGVKWVERETLLRTCDFLFVCLPLTESTLLTIDAHAISVMKPQALLINPSRGSVVDEQAVTEALASNKLAGYAADVFAFEDWARHDRPTKIPAALAAMPHKTLFTPHLGSATLRARLKIEQSAIHSVRQYFAGGVPQHAINATEAVANRSNKKLSLADD